MKTSLGEFVDQDHIVIGTTEDNGAVLGLGHIRRGGEGNTNVGMLVEDKDGFLPKLKEAFDCCGFNVKIHANIQQLIWDKLFTNVSLSAVTGILQVDMGYIASNEYAWAMTRRLIKEAVAVAKAMGLEADEECHCRQGKEDLRDVSQWLHLHPCRLKGRKEERGGHHQRFGCARRGKGGRTSAKP